MADTVEFARVLTLRRVASIEDDAKVDEVYVCAPNAENQSKLVATWSPLHGLHDYGTGPSLHDWERAQLATACARHFFAGDPEKHEAKP